MLTQRVSHAPVRSVQWVTFIALAQPTHTHMHTHSRDTQQSKDTQKHTKTDRREQSREDFEKEDSSYIPHRPLFIPTIPPHPRSYETKKSIATAACRSESVER